MNHDEQLTTLTAIVKRLVLDAVVMQDRLAKLEKADAFAADVVQRMADSGALAEYGNAIAELVAPVLCEKYGYPSALTGSIDGLDDVTLRVQMQTPPRGRAWAEPEWAEETRTSEPEWSGCSGVD